MNRIYKLLRKYETFNLLYKDISQWSMKTFCTDIMRVSVRLQRFLPHSKSKEKHGNVSKIYLIKAATEGVL